MKDNLLEIIRSCETTILSTFALDGYPESRTVINKMNENNKNFPLYFMTKDNSHKMEQINKNNKCSLYYFNSITRKAINLFGFVKTIEDKNIRSSLWNDDFRKFGYTDSTDKAWTLLKFTAQKYKFYVGVEEKTGSL